MFSFFSFLLLILFRVSIQQICINNQELTNATLKKVSQTDSSSVSFSSLNVTWDMVINESLTITMSPFNITAQSHRVHKVLIGSNASYIVSLHSNHTANNHSVVMKQKNINNLYVTFIFFMDIENLTLVFKANQTKSDAIIYMKAYKDQAKLNGKYQCVSTCNGTLNLFDQAGFIIGECTPQNNVPPDPNDYRPDPLPLGCTNATPSAISNAIKLAGDANTSWDGQNLNITNLSYDQSSSITIMINSSKLIQVVISVFLKAQVKHNNQNLVDSQKINFPYTIINVPDSIKHIHPNTFKFFTNKPKNLSFIIKGKQNGTANYTFKVKHYLYNAYINDSACSNICPTNIALYLIDKKPYGIICAQQFVRPSIITSCNGESMSRNTKIKAEADSQENILTLVTSKQAIFNAVIGSAVIVKFSGWLSSQENLVMIHIMFSKPCSIVLNEIHQNDRITVQNVNSTGKSYYVYAKQSQVSSISMIIRAQEKGFINIAVQGYFANFLNQNGLCTTIKCSGEFDVYLNRKYELVSPICAKQAFSVISAIKSCQNIELSAFTVNPSYESLNVFQMPDKTTFWRPTQYKEKLKLIISGWALQAQKIIMVRLAFKRTVNLQVVGKKLIVTKIFNTKYSQFRIIFIGNQTSIMVDVTSEQILQSYGAIQQPVIYFVAHGYYYSALHRNNSCTHTCKGELLSKKDQNEQFYVQCTQDYELPKAQLCNYAVHSEQINLIKTQFTGEPLNIHGKEIIIHGAIQGKIYNVFLSGWETNIQNRVISLYLKSNNSIQVTVNNQQRNFSLIQKDLQGFIGFRANQTKIQVKITAKVTGNIRIMFGVYKSQAFLNQTSKEVCKQQCEQNINSYKDNINCFTKNLTRVAFFSFLVLLIVSYF